MRAILRLAQANGRHPFINQAGILARAHVAMMINAARKQIFMRRTSSALEPGDQGRTDIRGKLELDRAISLLLDDNRTVPNVRAGYHVTNFDLHQIAATQLAVDCEVEERPVP